MIRGAGCEYGDGEGLEQVMEVVAAQVTSRLAG